jgi:hypothetical protein
MATDPLFFIDFETLFNRFGSQLFWENLKNTRFVIYDWGKDEIWILSNPKDEQNSTMAHMSGEQFSDLTGVWYSTARDFVFALLVSGIEVGIRNYGETFKTADEFKEFFTDLQQKSVMMVGGN